MGPIHPRVRLGGDDVDHGRDRDADRMEGRGRKRHLQRGFVFLDLLDRVVPRTPPRARELQSFDPPIVSFESYDFAGFRIGSVLANVRSVDES